MSAWLVAQGTDGALLALLLAGHMLGDFALQSRTMVARKREAAWLLRHAAALFLVQVLLLLPFLSLRLPLVLAALCLAHVGVDRLKTWAEDRDGNRILYFLADQAAHFCLLLAAWLFLRGRLSPPVFALTESQIRFIVVAAILVAAYAFNGHGAATLVAVLLRRYQLPDGSAASNSDPRARGWMIGILERTLILTLVLVDQWGALGLILAAKSIARFKDLDDRGFSEYYLIGTLASVLLAVALGLSVRFLIRV